MKAKTKDQLGQDAADAATESVSVQRAAAKQKLTT